MSDPPNTSSWSSGDPQHVSGVDHLAVSRKATLNETRLLRARDGELLDSF